MDGETFHKKKQKEVLTLCKELKSAYKKDWPYVMEIMFPESFSYLKLINKTKRYGKR